MKFILFILVIYFAFLSEMYSQKHDEIQCEKLTITNNNQSYIDLGNQYPGTNETLQNKILEFKIEGEKKKKFEWEISESRGLDLILTKKFYGSSDGRNWSEINRQGTTKLSNKGQYYIRIELQGFELKSGADSGDIEYYFTLTANYD